jgi:hypothetical protein
LFFAVPELELDVQKKDAELQRREADVQRRDADHAAALRLLEAEVAAAKGIHDIAVFCLCLFVACCSLYFWFAEQARAAIPASEEAASAHTPLWPPYTAEVPAVFHTGAYSLEAAGRAQQAARGEQQTAEGRRGRSSSRR